MKSPRELIAAHFDDALDSTGRVELLAWLKADDANLREFVAASVREEQLRAVASAGGTQQSLDYLQGPGSVPLVLGKKGGTFHWIHARSLLAVACVALLAIGVWMLDMHRSAPGAAVAWFEELHDPRWVHGVVQVQPGDGIRAGQLLELSAGRIRIRFASGATVTLLGPAMFEIMSENRGFLILGSMKAVADTPESRGFTVQTRTARVVDIGTEFVATAAADGQSRVDVTSGEVEVLLEGVTVPHRLRTGDALSIEAGKPQILVRIERGDDTAAFRFPTIEPPSSTDAADLSSQSSNLHVVRGMLHPTSGAVEKLLDGRGQSAADSPLESVYFANNEKGLLLMDLGRTLVVSKVNTYSWHQSWLDARNRLRAVQKYTLYGYDGDHPPPMNDMLSDSDWVKIARVDSDDFFRVTQSLHRPAQQACSITGAHGVIGRYRYLLWEVDSTLRDKPLVLNNTFYSEFDVYGSP